MGCEIVKLFPGSVYGPSFIKGIKGPQPWTNVMPTGGVSPDPENLKRWFEAGAYCVGLGSKLMVKNDDGSYDYKKVESLTRSTLELIQEIR
jgi:2-dehydro-3-deoxyphosphogluconate aldolase/(4S)-4-hydroxy-2-oxoglutarate aldolase